MRQICAASGREASGRRAHSPTAAVRGYPDSSDWVDRRQAHLATYERGLAVVSEPRIPASTRFGRAVRYTITLSGVPVGTVELDVEGELAVAGVRPLSGYAELRPVVRAAVGVAAHLLGGVRQ